MNSDFDDELSDEEERDESDEEIREREEKYVREVDLQMAAMAKALSEPSTTLSRLLKYSPTCGLPPLALALFFRQISAS